PALLEGDDHDVRSVQRRAAVGGLLHRRAEAVVGHELTGRLRDRTELVRVDVHQREGRIAQRWEGEDVPDEAEGEHETAGADEGDLGVLHERRCHGFTLGAQVAGGLPGSLAKPPGSYGAHGRWASMVRG